MLKSFEYKNILEPIKVDGRVVYFERGRTEAWVVLPD